MKCLEAQKWGKEFLAKSKLKDPALESNAILSGILNLSPTQVYLDDRKINGRNLARFRSAILRRSENEPVAYILGKKNFMGLELEVNSTVLIPRPETEILAEKLVNKIKQSEVHVLDLCTGSGCIAIALATHCPRVQIVAIDNSGAAMALAQKNADGLGVSSQITFKMSDLYSNIKPNYGGDFDIIVANPPYIPADQISSLAPDLHFEPRAALEAGSEGLDFFKLIIKDAPHYLKPHGEIWMEMGIGQTKAVRRLLSDVGFKGIQIFKDYAGIERIINGSI